MKIKNKLISCMVMAAALLFVPEINFGQAPDLGTAANFVLFSTTGAITNSGISQVTGNVGSNNGSVTGFGNVNGVMHKADSASAQCAKDLLKAYNFIKSATSDFTPSSTLGNGDTLVPGVYAISGASTLGGKLYLNAKGNSGALFIFQMSGAFSSKAASKVVLVNGAVACNVFWKIEGAVSLASGTTMRGTIIANNAAISIGTGDTLEGRALTTSGAVSVDGVLAYTPIGCGSPKLTGPTAPDLRTTICYALFSSDGAVTNSGTSKITGDVGTNVGLTTGFDTSLVKGMIHPKPDGSTAQCAADLTKVYNYLDSLPNDIELLYPADFGKNLVLTPHSYLLNAATTLTDSVYLNAEGDKDAVFVIKINGALSTSTYSNIILTNGTQSKNVYWVVNGAAGINNYSVFRGTLICNNGAIDAINTGVVLDGRAMTTTGSLKTTAVDVTMTPGCSSLLTGSFITKEPVNQTVCSGNSASFSVTAQGSNLSYQWRMGTVNLTNGGNISGAASATLSLSSISSSNASANYNVIVSGSNGSNDTSKNVSLIVNTAPAIITFPSDQTSCAGISVVFSVTATGTNLNYQWRKGNTNLINGTSISGATSATLTLNNVVPADAGTNYNVIVSGTCPANDTSKNVSLILNDAPVITSGPVSATVCEQDAATFSITATGTGLKYQWRNGSVNITDGGSISGATTANLTINPVYLSKAGSNYNVIVSGTCPSKDSSKSVSLNVNTSPVIIAGPVNQTAREGNSAGFSVIASGTGLTYQWRRGAGNLSDGGSISGATTATLTINPVNTFDSASNYNVVISGTCSPQLVSGDATLSVTTATGISLAGKINESVSIYPNPFSTSVSFILNNAATMNNCHVRIYNISGTEILNNIINTNTTTIQKSKIPSGIYFYQVINHDCIIQSGKLISL
jgi:hypothetical protein